VRAAARIAAAAFQTAGSGFSRTWLLALAIMVTSLAAGCSGTVPATGRHRVGGSPAAYWTRSRLIGARPLIGTGPIHGFGRKQTPLRGQSALSRRAQFAPRVGALFVREPGGDHFCTASVVASPGKDLLITAAHCINGGRGGGYRADIVFVPDYRDGHAPFGVWSIQRMLVAPQWASSSDPAFDVGFVVLKPHDGLNIEDILGANRLATDVHYTYLVRVTGYPASASAPIVCLNWTARQSAAQLRFECAGYTGGTSGSPWVTHFDPRTRDGTIVGVIGGYQEGGDTADVSYSPYLGSAIHRLYQEAAGLGAPRHS
jgi:V8-like Glu-specific endopeptidase